MKVVKRWLTHLDDEVEVFIGDDGQYHWHVQSEGNHENVGDGEGHPRLEDAVSAASRHHPPVTSEQ